jgi:hypothetical protein
VKPELQGQVREIASLLRASGLDRDELARRAVITPETLRKYAQGHNRCSGRQMQLLREVAGSEQLRLQNASARVSPDIHDEVVRYASKLLKLPAEKRRLLKELIDALGGSSVPDEKPAADSGRVPSGGADIQGLARAAGEAAVAAMKRRRRLS